MSTIMIHMRAFRLYRKYLMDKKILPKHHINEFVSALVFLITTVTLAPILAIPYILAPKIVAWKYAKALISTSNI